VSTTGGGPAPVRLVELDPVDPAWLELVRTAPDATAFHHPSWLAALVTTYGFRSVVLAHLDAAGRVQAGVPLVRVRRPSGRTWVCLPFSDHCPPLARDDASLARLAAGLAGWSREQRLPVEVRGGPQPAGAWSTATVGTRHVLPLEDGVEAAWAGLRPALRRQVREARRAGLTVRFTHAAEDMDAFYRLQVATRRRLGVPVQPRRFVAAVWRHVIEPGLGFAALAETPAGQAVAACVMLAWNRTLVEKFQASDAAHWRSKPNQLVIWSTIEWGCAEGYRAFDFGRSDAGHVSLQQFKAAWGAAELPLRHFVAGGAVAGLGGRGRLDGLLSGVIRNTPPIVCRALGDVLYRYAA
jgi:CelD/BcsL family acetyltransferase involved in cellulose biosynthesis